MDLGIVNVAWIGHLALGKILVSFLKGVFRNGIGRVVVAKATVPSRATPPAEEVEADTARLVRTIRFRRCWERRHLRIHTGDQTTSPNSITLEGAQVHEAGFES